MNSIKSTVTVLFLLFVSYGVYRVIHTPDPTASTTGSFVLGGNATAPATDSNSPIAKRSAPPKLISDELERVLAAPPTGGTPSREFTPMEPGAASKIAASPPPLSSSPRTPSDPVVDANPIAATTPPMPTDAQKASATTIESPSPFPSIEALSTANRSSPKPMTGPLTELAIVTPPNSEKPAPSTANFGSPVAGSPSNGSLAGTAAPVAAPSAAELTSAWSRVNSEIRDGQITEALQDLSRFYHSDLPPDQRAELLQWLDALAFKVIYSTENHLSKTPYVISADDTLESLSARWKVPQALILNVNRSKLPADGQFVPGLELKVLQGPFRAEIDCRRSELTLFMNELYAGRFPVDTTQAANCPAGDFPVQKLQRDASGSRVTGMDFGAGQCLTATGQGPPGAFTLRAADAGDVFGILGHDSRITVVR